MHALPGGEVQGTLPAVLTLRRPLRPQPQQPHRQDLADLAQPLFGGRAFIGTPRAFFQHCLGEMPSRTRLSFLFWDPVFHGRAAGDAVGHDQEAIGFRVLGQHENGLRLCTFR